MQTNNKQFETVVTFLTGYNGIFNVTNLNNKFCFKENFNDGESIQTSRSQGAYEIESLNNEIKRIIIDEGYYSENNYPFTIKPNFSTLGSIVDLSQTGPNISFVIEKSIGKVLMRRYYTMNIIYHLILWIFFHLIIFFFETDIAQGMIFKGERSGIIHNFTMVVDPGYKYIEKFTAGNQWYLMDTKDFISSINFNLKIENGNLVSFNGQSITFRLSIREV